MIPNTSSLSVDARSTDALRGVAARDPKAATKEVARQFEGLFMQELMKSMRQATPSSGLLDNAGTALGTEMLDTQFATQMTGQRGGLADVIARQIERQMGATPPAPPGNGVTQTVPVRSTLLGAPTPSVSGTGTAATSAKPATAQNLPRIAHGGTGAQGFVARNLQAARTAEAATGIPATFMLAQAALETGWGRKDIRMADGSASNNLFGIKAGANWKGPVAEVTTTEYVNGRPQKATARFRAYASAEESFADYARLMKESPRYAQVNANTGSAHGFAQSLQRAGYATDPRYAEKLSGVINTTLRLQRALG